MGHATLAASTSERPALPDRDRGGRDRRGRLGARRSARPDRRHIGLGQERIPAIDGGRPGGQSPADAAQLLVRRLQGRRLLAGVRAVAAHGRLRDQSQPRPRPAGADLVAGRAQPTNGHHGGPRQGSGRTPTGRSGRGTALVGDRDRRVRHVGERGARVRRGHDRHRPARPQPRDPSGARHPTPDRCGQREHPGQHQRADLVADARPRGVDGDHRQPRRCRHPGSAVGARAGAARPASVGRVPGCLRRRPADRRSGPPARAGRPVRGL